ncbi:hypothetical protein AKO1_013309 [Acrasis kona]|uniref:Uncharacterized protein n=1 Tax=Acrasis kona TaxID=1008807 RepID=A0AAW2YYH8_9EUKA
MACADEEMRWKTFCVQTWNLPNVFCHLLSNEECKYYCLRWNNCLEVVKRKKQEPDVAFVIDFSRFFKTYCGGGEHESQDVTSGSLRPRMVINRIQENFNSNPVGLLTSNVFCHLDVLSLETSNMTKYELQNEQKTQQEVWYRSLKYAMRCLDHASIDRDAPAIRHFISTFIELLSLSASRIEDDEDFVFFVHNSLKKLNIFLQAVKAKANYMMDYTIKLRWNELFDSIMIIWNEAPSTINQTFTRLQLIAVEEIRSDFGETKSVTLQRVFDTYFLLNTPKDVFNHFQQKQSTFTDVLDRNVYECEVLVKIYVMTLGSILFGNSQIIESVLQTDELRLQHFYQLIKSYQCEHKQMEILWAGCPSKGIRKFLKTQHVKWLLHIHILLTRILQRSFSTFAVHSHQVIDYHNMRNYHSYTKVPSDLELIFSRYVESDEDLMRFSCFMCFHFDSMFRILQVMNSFTNPLSKDQEIKKIVGALGSSQRGAGDDEDDDVVDVYGTYLFSDPRLTSLPQIEQDQEESTAVGGWEDDDSDLIDEPPNKKQKFYYALVSFVFVPK